MAILSLSQRHPRAGLAISKPFITGGIPNGLTRGLLDRGAFVDRLAEG